MAKAPTTETIAAELTVPERVLLFCLASDTNLGEGRRVPCHRPTSGCDKPGARDHRWRPRPCVGCGGGGLKTAQGRPAAAFGASVVPPYPNVENTPRRLARSRSGRAPGRPLAASLSPRRRRIGTHPEVPARRRRAPLAPRSIGARRLYLANAAWPASAPYLRSRSRRSIRPTRHDAGADPTMVPPPSRCADRPGPPRGKLRASCGARDAAREPGACAAVLGPGHRLPLVALNATVAAETTPITGRQLGRPAISAMGHEPSLAPQKNWETFALKARHAARAAIGCPHCG